MKYVLWPGFAWPKSVSFPSAGTAVQELRKNYCGFWVGGDDVRVG